MSHFQSIKTLITDTSVLQQTLYQLGYEVYLNKPIYHCYSEENVVCKISTNVKKVDGESFPIGWKEEINGTLTFYADLWELNKCVKEEVSEFINKINQTYAVNLTLKETQKNKSLSKTNIKVLFLGQA